MKTVDKVDSEVLKAVVTDLKQAISFIDPLALNENMWERHALDAVTEIIEEIISSLQKRRKELKD